MVGNLQMKALLQLQQKTISSLVPELLPTVCGCKSSICGTRSCKNATRMVSFARICVVVATNIVKILIRRKFQKMIPVMEKMKPTTKERTTHTYRHIYGNYLLLVLVYVFCLFSFYEGHIIYSYLRSGKQDLSDHLF